MVPGELEGTTDNTQTTDNRITDIATYRLNWPRGRFIDKYKSKNRSCRIRKKLRIRKPSFMVSLSGIYVTTRRGRPR